MSTLLYSICTRKSFYFREKFKNEFKGDVYHSYGNSQSRAVSIYISDHTDYPLIDKFQDE